MNLLMISYYNLGVEMEHLHNLEEALRVYGCGTEIAKQHAQGKNMLRVLADSLSRIEQSVQYRHTKMNRTLEKKRELEAKNYSEYMRKNKKHDPTSDYSVIKPIRKPHDFSLMRNRFLSTNGDTIRKQQSEVKMNNRTKEIPRNLYESKAATKSIR